MAGQMSDAFEKARAKRSLLSVAAVVAGAVCLCASGCDTVGRRDESRQTQSDSTPQVRAPGTAYQDTTDTVMARLEGDVRYAVNLLGGADTVHALSMLQTVVREHIMSPVAAEALYYLVREAAERYDTTGAKQYLVLLESYHPSSPYLQMTEAIVGRFASQPDSLLATFGTLRISLVASPSVFEGQQSFVRGAVTLVARDSISARYPPQFAARYMLTELPGLLFTENSNEEAYQLAPGQYAARFEAFTNPGCRYPLTPSQCEILQGVDNVGFSLVQANTTYVRVYMTAFGDALTLHATVENPPSAAEIAAQTSERQRVLKKYPTRSAQDSLTHVRDSVLAARQALLSIANAPVSTKTFVELLGHYRTIDDLLRALPRNSWGGTFIDRNGVAHQFTIAVAVMPGDAGSRPYQWITQMTVQVDGRVHSWHDTRDLYQTGQTADVYPLRVAANNDSLTVTRLDCDSLIQSLTARLVAINGDLFVLGQVRP